MLINWGYSVYIIESLGVLLSQVQVDFAQFSFLFCLYLIQDGIDEDIQQHGVIQNENDDGGGKNSLG